MLLQSFRLIWFLILFDIAFCNDVNVTAVLDSRDKRSLDFGVFLKNLLQQSADLSSNAKTTRPPMNQRTTTTTTTTTAAPSTVAPTMPQAFLQKTFYKAFPGLGRVGYGFGVPGHLANQPFFYPIDPQGGGYIDFDYTDGIVAPTIPSMATTTTPTTTTTTTTTTAPPMMTTQPAPAPAPQPQPAGLRRKPRPILRILPPNTQQPGSRIVYQYIPTPYFNTQTPNPQVQAQENYASSPSIDYDNQDPYSGPQRNQPPSYDYQTTFYNARPVAAQRRPTPTTLAAKTQRPIIIAPNAAFNSGRSRLSDNLIYQFAPNDDIYSRADANDGNDVSAEGVVANGNEAANADVETPNDTDVPTDDYNVDGNNYESASATTISPNAIPANDEGNYDSASLRPAVQQNYANIDYVDNNAPHDVSGPFAFQLNAHDYNLQNDDHYSTKNSAQKQGLFVYTNSPQKDQSDLYSAHQPVAGHTASSYASMRIRTPYADFHTSTINNGHHNDKNDGEIQHFPIPSKYY